MDFYCKPYFFWIFMAFITFQHIDNHFSIWNLKKCKLVWSAKTESWIVYHQKGQRLCFPMVTYGSFDKHTGLFTVKNRLSTTPPIQRHRYGLKIRLTVHSFLKKLILSFIPSKSKFSKKKSPTKFENFNFLEIKFDNYQWTNCQVIFSLKSLNAVKTFGF